MFLTQIPLAPRDITYRVCAETIISIQHVLSELIGRENRYLKLPVSY